MPSTNLVSNIDNSGEIGIGAKKKKKFVPLYSKEGQAKAVIKLPGKTEINGFIIYVFEFRISGKEYKFESLLLHKKS